jgi:hypothetical protein
VANLGLLDSGVEPRFDAITRSAAELTGVPMAAINFFDDRRQFSKSFAGLDGAGQSTPIEDTICKVTVRTARPVVVDDLAADSRFNDLPSVVGDLRLRAYAGMPVKGPTGEVVGSLCVLDTVPHAFTERDRRVLRNLADWVERELLVDQELESAAHVQRALLPRAPLRLPGFDIAGGCRPAHAVGGDFFDWCQVDGGAQITVGDVMGKGVGAAILAASVRAFLRGSRRLDAAAAVKSTAVALLEDLDEAGSFVTLFHMRLGEDGSVSFVDAGHGLARIVRADGRLEKLTSTDRPIGILPEDDWTAQTVELQAGDTLLIASDGILDRVSEGPAADEELVRTVAGAADAQAIIDHYLSMAVAGGAGLDDTTQVVVRRI